MNVVAIESRTHNILIKRAYNTADHNRESKRLARDLNSLSDGTSVMIAVKEDGRGALTQGVATFLA
jgi:hypothetical protein